MRPILILTTLCCMTTCVTPASAVQNSTRLIEIKVNGSERFKQDTLVNATALKLGMDGPDNVLKQSAERLAASGMFSDVTYRYLSGPEGTKAEFQVHDTAKLLPATFDNFVWLPREELITRLKNLDPLFVGQIPNAGEMSQHLAENIKVVLTGLDVSGEVSVLPQVPPLGGEVFGYVYRVEGVKIPVRNVQFTGASPAMTGILSKLAGTTLVGNNYSEASATSVAKLDFLPQYRMRGFLRAAFDSPVPEIQDRITGDVLVKLAVSEGICYQLSAVQWSGNKAYTSTELEKALKAPLGATANQITLEENLASLGKAYGTKGYMDARLVPNYRFDDAAKSVAVDVDVKEGDQYRMGQVQFLGMTESAAAPLLKLWKLNPGDVYDSSYPGTFLSSAGSRFDLSRFRIGITQKRQRENKTVDVILQFSAK